jgi:hypothetical protein
MIAGQQLSGKVPQKTRNTSVRAIGFQTRSDIKDYAKSRVHQNLQPVQ